MFCGQDKLADVSNYSLGKKKLGLPPSKQRCKLWWVLFSHCPCSIIPFYVVLPPFYLHVIRLNILGKGSTIF